MAESDLKKRTRRFYAELYARACSAKGDHFAVIDAMVSASLAYRKGSWSCSVCAPYNSPYGGGIRSIYAEEVGEHDNPADAVKALLLAVEKRTKDKPSTTPITSRWGFSVGDSVTWDEALRRIDGRMMEYPMTGTIIRVTDDKRAAVEYAAGKERRVPYAKLRKLERPEPVPPQDGE